LNTARNIPLFIAFRVLFNARFYYPVIGILFLDLGLTLEQYSLLNVAWAVAIVTLELPSGALADVIGRRRMVVLAALLMVAEMLLFALAPTGRPGLLFAMLLINRILSGAAEASASGADEALAFDSLPPNGRESTWPRVLERLMRWQSGGFFVAMILGALLYDPSAVQQAVAFFGGTWSPAPGALVRWPVYLTLGTSLVCLAIALGLREPPGSKHQSPSTLGPALRQAWQNIRSGGFAVVTDRRILLILLAALSCDSLVRLFLTFQSNYLRLITVPEFLFGIIGSALALLGFLAAPVARRMVGTLHAPTNFLMVAGLIIIGLMGATFALPLVGVWVIIPLGLAMNLTGFFVSHYLNLWTAADIRATVLSFRGVALNLTYGSAGLLFAGLTNSIRNAGPEQSESAIFSQSLIWLPVAFGAMILLVGIFALASRQRTKTS
jgi:MFS family permease